MDVIADGIAALLYREPLLKLHNGPDVLHCATQAGNFTAQVDALASMRTNGAVNRAERKVGQDLARFHSVESIGSGKTAEGEVLEESARSVAEYLG